MRRSTVVLAVLAAAAVLVAGCGGQQSNAKNARKTLAQGMVDGPYLFNYAGAKRELAKDGVRIREVGASDLANQALPRPQSGRKYETQGGTPFVLLLFQSEDTANDALQSLESKTKGEVVVGKNFLAVIQAQGKDTTKLRTSLEQIGDNPPGPEPRSALPVGDQ